MKLKDIYKVEKEFHDNWAKSLSLDEINFKQAFETITATENRFALSQMLPIKGKHILDIGCGMGDTSIYFGLKGAKVDAVDISPGMISVVKKLASKYKLSRTVKAEVMVAEKLEFPDSTFDFVFGNGLLHHTNHKLTLKEVYRVLKPGGKAFFIEPLAHNFLINVYRKKASDVRTSTEKPLIYKELSNMTTEKFNNRYHKEFHFFTLLIFIWFYIVQKSDPNKERYWKKIIDDSKKIEKGFKILYSLDKVFLKGIPFLRKYCWNTVLVFEK